LTILASIWPSTAYEAIYSSTYFVQYPTSKNQSTSPRAIRSYR
jgi:hypothetical protein